MHAPRRSHLLAPACALLLATPLDARAAPRFDDALDNLGAQACGGGGCWTNYLRVADLDLDDDLDIVFVNYSGFFSMGAPQPLVTMVNNGDAVFTDHSDTILGGYTERLRQVAIGDVDGDGAPDIVAPSAWGDASALFINNGDGTFDEEGAARLPATDLVRVLNTLFSTFDNLAQRLGVEKIKTIGDAYMIVAGVPVERPDHANAVAEFALMLQEELQRIELPVDARVVLRIGVHSGQVVAGVIGTDKFTYDLWGDTVNTASRMESHGVPGRIQVSDATYELLKDDYAFEPRGTIRVKGKGTMETYFLLGRRADPTSSPATSDPPS